MKSRPLSKVVDQHQLVDQRVDSCEEYILLARLISTLLFEVNASDSTVFLAAPTLLILVALGAACIPARKAATIDPTAWLRKQ